MSYDNNHQAIVDAFLSKSSRIAFLHTDYVANNKRIILSTEGIFKIFDISSFPGNLSQRAIEKELEKMGDSAPVIGTVTYKCNNRMNGDFILEVKSTNGDLVVRMERKKRFGILWLKDGDKDIPVCFPDGKIASVVHDCDGGYNAVAVDVEGEDRLSFKCETPAWQTRTKWILCAFCCFLPTLSLGSCFGLYKASTCDLIRNYTKIHQGATIELGAFIDDVINFEGTSSWKEKLALVSLKAFMLVDFKTQPPSSQGHNHY
jgi:hypothetical protein